MPRLNHRATLKATPGRSLYSYALYGVRLRSQWKLPYPESDGSGARAPVIELVEGPAVLFERLGTTLVPKLRWPGDLFEYNALDDGTVYLRWPGFCEFLIRPNGRRILGRFHQRIPLDSFLVYLVSAALSFCLLKLGADPLHGTVVVVNGAGIGFLGNTGYGKSSLAAAFLQSGYSVLTDDLLVLRTSPSGYFAYPGAPQVKMFGRTASRVFGKPVTGVPMNPITRKLIIPLSRRQSAKERVLLKALYALNRPEVGRSPNGITIRRLSRRRVLMKLVGSTFNDWVGDAPRLERQLFEYSRIAAKVPVKQLSYPRRLDRIGAVRDAILRDSEAL